MGNAQQNTQRKTGGQIVGHFVGQIPVNRSVSQDFHGNAQQYAQGLAQGKIIGQIVPRPAGKSVNAQTRVEWFRYELDFRRRPKGGYQVIIRRRLKWSKSRYAPTIANHLCAGLTKQMVASIKKGKFTGAAIVALQNGGISHGVIQKLTERIGKGNGKRAAELTNDERSVLSRIESSLRAGYGSRDASTAGMGREVAVADTDVSNASDSLSARVSNMR